MNPQATLASQTLSQDGKGVVQTYTVTMTEAQLQMQLSQIQQKVSQLNNQTSLLNANIASVQSQIALFKPAATGV